MIIELLKKARSHSRKHQGGFTLVELLVVVAILGILAAIVLFNVAGVNNQAACAGLKTDGGTIQAAADIYANNNGNKYPVGPPPVGQTDTTTPPAGSTVNITELLGANLLHQAPPASETWTYNATPTGTVHGVSTACAGQTYN